MKAIIFDLDGTLLDSLHDLGNAMNRVLMNHNFPIHDIKQYQTFVGNGIYKLVQRSLPETCTDVQPYFEEYLDSYDKGYKVDSKLYEGVYDTLKTLNQKGVKIAVHTNKMQRYTSDIIEHYFDGIHFIEVMGDQGDNLHKPNPHHTLGIAKKLGMDPQDILFVGDSNVDIETAVNAKMIPVGVSWGFRSVEELKNAGAMHIIDGMHELLELIS